MSAPSKVDMKFSDGTVVNTWLSFTLRDTYTDPLGELSFEVAPNRGKMWAHAQLFKKGELVNIAINDVPQGQYVITTVSVKIGMSSVLFSITCKTPLATAYEGGVDPDFVFHAQTDAPVTAYVLDVLSPYGYDKAVGDTAASVNTLTGKAIGNRKPTRDVEQLKHQDAQPHDGETAYQLCARVVTRLGLCIRQAADSDVTRGGSLLLGAPDYDQDALYTLVQTFTEPVAGADRMLADIEVIDTNENQFAECILRGQAQEKKQQARTDRPASSVTSASLNSQRPCYQSTEMPHKPLYIKDKHSRDVLRCSSTAKLAMGLRAKDAFVVSCEVPGFVSRTGALWQVDTIASVRIDALDIREDMWILERTFKCTREQAQVTSLKLIPKGNLVIGDAP